MAKLDLDLDQARKKKLENSPPKVKKAKLNEVHSKAAKADKAAGTKLEEAEVALTAAVKAKEAAVKRKAETEAAATKAKGELDALKVAVDKAEAVLVPTVTNTFAQLDTVLEVGPPELREQFKVLVDSMSKAYTQVAETQAAKVKADTEAEAAADRDAKAKAAAAKAAATAPVDDKLDVEDVDGPCDMELDLDDGLMEQLA